jgi:hypothetical protein
LVALDPDDPQYDPNGLFTGKSEMLLGLLYRTKKKREFAVQHLSEAKRILSQFGQTPILARVETALAELGQFAMPAAHVDRLAKLASITTAERPPSRP